jgi:hypothetical protein
VLRQNALTLALVAAIAVLVWLFLRPAPTPTSVPPPAPTAESKIETQNSKIPPPAPERSTLADALNSPAATIADDLRLVAVVLENFRSNFPRSGNPVGLNSEITAALTGQNQLRLALIPPDHPAINKSGELTDRWGTPFFFHAESATRMTITSAGPDKKLHTPDDESFAP